MADEYHDINKYARDGGDTAPGTREQIKERNDAADKLAEVAREQGQRQRELQDERGDALREAEDAYAEAVPSPGVVPPSDPDAKPARSGSSRR